MKHLTVFTPCQKYTHQKGKEERKKPLLSEHLYNHQSPYKIQLQQPYWFHSSPKARFGKKPTLCGHKPPSCPKTQLNLLDQSGQKRKSMRDGAPQSHRTKPSRRSPPFTG